MSVGLVVVVSAVRWFCPVGVNGGACNMWFMRPRGGRGDAPSHPPWHNMRPMGVRGCPLPPIGNVDAIAARGKRGGAEWGAVALRVPVPLPSALTKRRARRTCERWARVSVCVWPTRNVRAACDPCGCLVRAGECVCWPSRARGAACDPCGCLVRAGECVRWPSRASGVCVCVF